MRREAKNHKQSIKGASSKEHLLRTAITIFAELGYEGTTMRNIARKADMNIATLLYHFPNKEELYFEVFKVKSSEEFDLIKKWHDSITEKILLDKDMLRQALLDAAGILMERIMEDPTMFRLNIYHRIQLSTQTIMNSVNSPDPIFGLFEDILEQAVKLKTLKVSDNEIRRFTEETSWLSTGFFLMYLPLILKSEEEKNRCRKLFMGSITYSLEHIFND